MDGQTLLNILLALATLYLGIQNFQITRKKEEQRESREMAEIQVQLQQVMGMLRDVQKDIRTSTADFRALSERVVKIETKLDAAFAQIDELKKEHLQHGEQ